jgi:uncharacterized protein (TIGR02678 family)
MKKLEYNEDFISCINALLNQRTIFRKKEENLFNTVREYEPELRRYFNDNFRYQIISKPNFIKLEKVPEKYHQWMAVDGFNKPKDFVMFFCLLSFLEDKVDTQFSLVEVCQSIVLNYPEEYIGWTGGEGRQNRLSLVRVLKYAEEYHLLKVEDREIEGFAENENHGVLFIGTNMIKYFIRNFAFDVQKAEYTEDIKLMHEREQTQSGLERKHKMYRRLYSEPVLYQWDVESDEWDYLKNYGYSIKDHIAKYTNFELEMYRNSFIMTTTTPKFKQDLFPEENKSLGKRSLELALLLRSMVAVETDENGECDLLGKDGSIVVSPTKFELLIEEVRERYKQHWSDAERKKTVSEWKKELVEYLLNWKLISFNSSRGTVDINIHDTIARYEAVYPSNSLVEGEE